jgi:hypothetical protein
MKNDIITRNDVINSILLIITYFLWLRINNVNIIEFLKNYLQRRLDKTKKRNEKKEKTLDAKEKLKEKKKK